MSVLIVVKDTRYLTPEGKVAELEYWRSAQRTSVRPPGDAGGHGFVDPEIVPWCDVLNAIDGVCTLQSCCGHRTPSADGEGDHVWNGQVWLWLSEPLAMAVYKHIGSLGRSALFDSVALLFGKGQGEREVLDVTFVPKPGNMDRAMKALADFLRTVRDW